MCKNTLGTSGVLAVLELGGRSFRSNYCSRAWPLITHPMVCSLFNRVENTRNMSKRLYFTMPMHYTSCQSVYVGGRVPGARKLGAFLFFRWWNAHSFNTQHYLLNPIYVHFLYTFNILVALTWQLTTKGENTFWIFPKQNYGERYNLPKPQWLVPK